MLPSQNRLQRRLGTSQVPSCTLQAYQQSFSKPAKNLQKGETTSRKNPATATPTVHRVTCGSSHRFFASLLRIAPSLLSTTERYDARLDLFALRCHKHDAVFCGLRQDLHPSVLGNLNIHRIEHQQQNLRFESTSHSEFKSSGLVHETFQIASAHRFPSAQEQDNIPKTNVCLVGARRHVSATEQ